MKEPLSLQKFIFINYARSALIPILTIEFLLLLTYFVTNFYIVWEMTKTLRSEVSNVMPDLVEKQSKLIDSQFENIARQTAYFAEAHERLLDSSFPVHVEGGEPIFKTAHTGALYQENRKEWSSLYFPFAAQLKKEQLEKARITASLDPLYRQLVRKMPNVVASYFNTYDNMNRLYPFIPDVYKQYPPDIKMAEYNFYYLADSAHNPERKPVWTGVYLDPAGQGWMLSCVAPVYHDGFLEGVVGLDVTIANIVDQVLSMQLPWGSTAFLADHNGMILAMSPKVEALLGLSELKQHVYSKAITKEQLKPEKFNLFKGRDSVISSEFLKISNSRDSLSSIVLGGSEFFVVQKIISSTNWRLFVLVDSASMLEPVNKVERISHLLGFLIIAGMVIFYAVFFLLLRNRAKNMAGGIAEPVIRLDRAASILGAQKLKNDFPASNIMELDSLSSTFVKMADEIEDRSKALVESEVRVRMQEKEAEVAFSRGMFEASSGYLHNVGNSITSLDSALHDLDEVLRSTIQYNQVFAKLAKGDDPELLERFRKILVERTVPKMQSSVEEIRAIKLRVQQTISHQQQTVRDSKETVNPTRFDMAALVRDVISTIKLTSDTYTIVSELPTVCWLVHHRNQIWNGVVNVLKNAIEACESMGNGVIVVKLESTEAGCRIQIIDSGSGVDPENLSKVMSAGFSTKVKGNGFGLHSFAIFLTANQGALRIESPGINLGTTVTIEVAHAK